MQIKIDKSGESNWIYYPDEWKMYAYGEDFDEMFVLVENRTYMGSEYADWWIKAKEVLDDLDNYEPIPGRVFDFYGKDELSHEQRKAVLKVYENCRYSDDAETIVAVANILYPDREFDVTEIYGYSQGDWATVAYDKKAEESLKDVESWFFGNVSEIICEDRNETYCCPITDEKLWELQRGDDVKGNILEYCGMDRSTECEMYEFDGYTQVAKWKEIV